MNILAKLSATPEQLKAAGVPWWERSLVRAMDVLTLFAPSPLPGASEILPSQVALVRAVERAHQTRGSSEQLSVPTIPGGISIEVADIDAGQVLATMVLHPRLVRPTANTNGTVVTPFDGPVEATRLVSRLLSNQGIEDPNLGANIAGVAPTYRG